MKHTIIFKHKDCYASFPLLQRIDGKLIIGYFKAPMVDHTGIFEWKVEESSDEGKTWRYVKDTPYDWPAVSPRERSDRFTTTLPDGREMATGSFGFKLRPPLLPNDPEKIRKSNCLFLRISSDGWKTIDERAWEIPNADVVLTFPRHLKVANLVLVPVYVILKNKFSRCLVWRSLDYGENWRLINMFPLEVNSNEMSFIKTENGILAHIRSDTNPYIMESWSDDNGRTWTYPTNIYGRRYHKDDRGSNVAGGPTHLLRLHDSRILCSYGYRFGKMGIRAIVSEDEGSTWGPPIILREDGGYRSSLHRSRFWQKKVHSGMDLGYPVSVQIDNGKILTAYYFTGADKITCVAMTMWEVK